MRQSPQPTIGMVVLLALLCGRTLSHAETPVDFNSQIRPLLTRYCTSCHGGVKAAGDVSLIYADRVLPPDGWIIEPGDPEASVLIERITSDDPDVRMPPPEEHPDPLPSGDVKLIRRWIEEGARWDAIWSITPLQDAVQVTLPTEAASSEAASSEAEHSGWARTRLDQLVKQRFAGSGMSPSPAASPAEWLRRVSLDLIGLPPTVQQINHFNERLQDVRTEHARENVYNREVDRLLSGNHFGERWASIWMDLARYADSQGFEKDPHRDMWPYRDWLIDAFNADMPYDDFTIKQLAGDLLPEPTASDLIATAFHRNTMTNTEGGTDDEEFRVAAIIDRISTTWTVWQATTMGCVQCHSHPYDALEHDEFYACMALFNNTLDVDLNDDYPTVRVPNDPAKRDDAIEAFRAFEIARRDRNQVGWQLTSETNWQTLQPLEIRSNTGKMKIVGDQIVTDGGTFNNQTEFNLVVMPKQKELTALQIEILPLVDDPLQWPEQGSVLTQLEMFLVADDENDQEVKVELADVFVDALTESNDPRDALKGNATGVGGYPKLTRPRTAVFVLKQPLKLTNESKIRLKMKQAASVTGNLTTPLRRVRWSASDASHWAELISADRLKDANERYSKSQNRVRAIQGAKLPIVWSLSDQEIRSTRQFVRGNWLEKADEVAPAIPKLFSNGGRVATGEIDDRLKFARWLVSDQNPLAARVWANRIWEQLFGIGIVETLEDFGSSGLLPVHGALLDHLAMQLRDTHQWHLKPFLREVVLSSTYRQTNQVSPDVVHHDPQNRFLARGPRTRLSAEMVRDQALLVSGLLSEQIGGVSVMPPQPDGIWMSVYNNQKWETAEGDQRYRRGLYTYWRRTSPYPSFLMFDSPTRDLCSARRISTNTPLQALVTLNDPVYVECSEALASRAIEAFEEAPSAIRWMALAVTQQELSEAEAIEILGLYQDLSEVVGNDSMDSHAMSIVANTLLNWDKALTK